ncbi:uncharacterized protein LOC119377021 [Rhipicephalus sanguineus]|uniref:uncharacterized protein LOC119377021 n=1 Tax=Rhipicephalus sanguineus TaxID=34632 RepID=UPI00189462FA|nr:uncharacterized protein LOC119377021 [Rhipicephalus sanguineus]
MKMIKHHILDRSTRDTRAILGLDLEKAFDISHQFILTSIAGLELGPRVYNSIRSFLSRRIARLKVESCTSDEVVLGSRGTPQGSVISPTLFNVAIIGLSKRLSQVEGIKHTIYADDITIWCTGSEGQVESVMQEAIYVTEQFLLPTGLKCSPAKSEHLLYKKRPRGGSYRDWKPASESGIRLHTGNGSPVPRVDSIRILGMFIESNGANGMALRQIVTKTENALRLIRRISNRHRGLKEDNLIRLIHAFVLCHFTYTVAMHNWQRAEREKLNALIRKVVKKALGLPIRTHRRSPELGIHSTLEVIAEAQERAQLLRLSGTPAGRKILEEIGFNPIAHKPSYAQIPTEIRNNIYVAHIPRNVHPVHNTGRRKARAAAILGSLLRDGTDASFVDAAEYVEQDAFSAVGVNAQCQVVNCAAVRTPNPEEAEQVAIALAMLDDRRETVYSDSKAAIRAFQIGCISRLALRVLQTSQHISSHSLHWFPAHIGEVQGIPANPNEVANGAARGMTDRAASNPVPHPGHRDAPYTYNEITEFFYLARRVYPLRTLTSTDPKQSPFDYSKPNRIPVLRIFTRHTRTSSRTDYARHAARQTH